MKDVGASSSSSRSIKDVGGGGSSSMKDVGGGGRRCTFVALLPPLHSVLVLQQLSLRQPAEGVGGQGAGQRLVLLDEGLDRTEGGGVTKTTRTAGV